MPEVVEEVNAGAAEDTEVEVMVVTIVVGVVAYEDVVEVAMVITHMGSPEGTEHSCQRPRYTL